MSTVALGGIWGLSHVSTHAHPAIGGGLFLGWVLMPSLLLLSLRHPRARYALVVPSSLVSLSLLLLCVSALPPDGLGSAGWRLVTGGVLMGSLLGVWFWFRWLPVPEALSDPLCAGRWALIALHACTVMLGVALLAASIMRQV